ncbi:MAG: phosphatidylserine synthase [Amphiamblys sp. WSBS2006]|nr:MAG: phosphatidylserine synthase [Amphiamblys sp. WSBS2006]
MSSREASPAHKQPGNTEIAKNIFWGCVSAAVLYTGYTSKSTDYTENVLRALAVASLSFVAYAVFFFRDGILNRPHPVIWNVVFAVSLLYFFFLFFFFFQTVEDARKLMGKISPELGVPIEEKPYAVFCEFNFENVRDRIDFYVFAHVVGWFVKALLLRDYFLCWALSIFFEVVEYSLSFQLDNFKECWWDSILLDVLICNSLGIHFGMLVCDYLKMRRFEWREAGTPRTIRGKLKRSISKIAPKTWRKFDWRFARSFKNYLVFLFLLVAITTCDINYFYLKYLLYIPPPHTINTVRVVTHAIAGFPALTEAYSYLYDKECTSLGPQATVTLLSLALEAAICVKFSKGVFPNSPPENVVLLWQGILLLAIIFPMWRFVINKARKKNRLD